MGHARLTLADGKVLMEYYLCRRWGKVDDGLHQRQGHELAKWSEAVEHKGEQIWFRACEVLHALVSGAPCASSTTERHSRHRRRHWLSPCGATGWLTYSAYISSSFS